MSSYNLNDTFQFRGTWVLPETPERKVSGALSYANGKTTLELDEPFSDVSADGQQILAGSQKNYSCVFGTATNGELLTIWEASSSGATMHIVSGELRQTERMVSSFLFVGAHVPRGCVFAQTNFVIPGLELWLSKRIVHFDPEEYALSGGDTANYKVKQPDQDVIRLESIFSTVSLGTIVQMPGMPFVDLKVTAESYSRFTPDVPKELDWHIKRSMALCAFLTLSAACPMYPSRIQAKIHQDSEPIHILVGLQRRQTCKFEHLHEFFLVRGALGIELADAIKKWFSVYEKFETACGLTVSVLNSEGLWLHVEFLSLMQALEGYHRSAFDGLYMKDADYEPVKTALSTAIPIDVSADHRSALKARIRYGNQWALRKRLADLTTKLEEQTKKLLLGVVGAIPDRWVDTRNYYTHWDESLRGAVLDNAEMLYACVRMKNLLRVLYLREAGIPFEQINQALKHTSDAAQQLIFANARNRGLGH